MDEGGLLKAAFAVVVALEGIGILATVIEEPEPRYVPGELHEWYGGFPECMSGPATECQVSCRIGYRIEDLVVQTNYDTDGDHDVDLADFALIQENWPAPWFAAISGGHRGR